MSSLEQLASTRRACANDASDKYCEIIAAVKEQYLHVKPSVACA